MSDKIIVIVDYDMGNIGSVENIINKVGGTSIISRDKRAIEKAEKLILPGDGAFDQGIINLKKYKLFDLINYKVQKKKTPILGICIGMQLMSITSEEGKEQGFSWIDAKTVKFSFSSFKNKIRIPHMGWNNIVPKKKINFLKGLNSNSRFYFVHSYHLICTNRSDIAATTNYGYDFVSIVNKENIYGTQFHPEKSHKYGMRLYKNFIHI